MAAEDGLKPISAFVRYCWQQYENCTEPEISTQARSPAGSKASKTETPPWPLWNSLDLLSEPIPEIEYILDGMLPAGAVALLSGREGSLKSWIALEWAHAVAEGNHWLGKSTKNVSVLFVDAEMQLNLLRSRVRPLGGSKNLHIWHWQSEKFPSSLNHRGFREFSRRYKLIVIDCLKRFMEGLDENSSQDMAVITKQLRELTRYGATVLALHHAPKDSAKHGYRGSTELGAGVDICMNWERIERNGMDIIQLTAPKTRYPEDPRMILRVIRTPEKPIFEDATREGGIEAINQLEAKLERIEGIIRNIAEAGGRKPNQSDIIRIAQSQNVASRNTILELLKQGEGKRWRSYIEGRSLNYELLSNCPAP